MHLKLIRKTFTKDTTIGELYIDGKFFCYTLEDVDRNLKQNDSLLYIKANKVFGTTAIPLGLYKVIVNMSPKFKRLLPRLLNVKGYDGVLMHRGNFAKDTLGCILVGYKKDVNQILKSTDAETDLVDLLLNEEDITLEIIRDEEAYKQFKGGK